MSTRPLIMITNDDGYDSNGITVLSQIARSYGDVVVVAPHTNASAKSHSLTVGMPLRAFLKRSEDIVVYACTGTPADCVKLGVEHLCPRRPDLVLSGINHGSNASINILYSGTMGAALEAAVCGYPAIGFSLLSHRTDAEYEAAVPYMQRIIEYAITHGLPKGCALNVNIPILEKTPNLKGMKVCRAAVARWTDSFERRVDPHGMDYYWLTGKFVCDDDGVDADQRTLEDGYITIVPCRPDFTCAEDIRVLADLNQTL